MNGAPPITLGAPDRVVAASMARRALERIIDSDGGQLSKDEAVSCHAVLWDQAGEIRRLLAIVIRLQERDKASSQMESLISQLTEQIVSEEQHRWEAQQRAEKALALVTRLRSRIRKMRASGR